MQIHLDTSSASLDELTALIALLASLGGRLPDALTEAERSWVEQTGEHVSSMPVDRPAPPAPATPADAAEALIAHAVATRTAPPPPSDPNAIVLDPDGIPWDERIHASTRSRNADQRWTKKRKVDEVLYGQVFAELQERYGEPDPNPGTGTTNEVAGPNGSDTVATPAPPPPASDGPTASAAPPPPPVESPKDRPEASAPTAPPPPASTAVESATGAGRFATFPDFVGAVNLLKAPSGKSYTYVELAGFSEMFGAPAFKDMKDKPEAWEDFYATAGGQ